MRSQVDDDGLGVRVIRHELRSRGNRLCIAGELVEANEGDARRQRAGFLDGGRRFRWARRTSAGGARGPHSHHLRSARAAHHHPQVLVGRHLLQILGQKPREFCRGADPIISTGSRPLVQPCRVTARNGRIDVIVGEHLRERGGRLACFLSGKRRSELRRGNHSHRLALPRERRCCAARKYRKHGKGTHRLKAPVVSCTS